MHTSLCHIVLNCDVISIFSLHVITKTFSAIDNEGTGFTILTSKHEVQKHIQHNTNHKYKEPYTLQLKIYIHIINIHYNVQHETITL
jgi:hypothetical protein